MSDKLPIDRVRNRVEGGPEIFETANETYSEKDAKLERNAPLEQGPDEDEESFKKRVEDRLKDATDDVREDADQN